MSSPSHHHSSLVRGFAVTLFIALSLTAVRAEYTAKSVEKPLPEGVSDDIAGALGKTCYEVMEGDKLVFEFWLASGIALKETPSSVKAGLDTLPVAALLGVVQVHEDRRDYRDDELRQGVFTMRFSKIPADGNHLGASEYPYFVALIPVADDRNPDGISTYKGVTKASSADTASQHPMIMSLRPVDKKPDVLPAITESGHEHQAIVVTAGGQAEGEDKDELVFEIVVEGMGEI